MMGDEESFHRELRLVSIIRCKENKNRKRQKAFILCFQCVLWALFSKQVNQIVREKSSEWVGKKFF